MKKVLILGGGFAGLSAACFLADKGFKVEVIEASKKLGGRAYSLLDYPTNTVIDNGQHILMGCYKETLKFLKLINADYNLVYQKKLKVNFVKEEFNLFSLKSSKLIYPFNFISGLLNYKAIPFSDRLKLLKFFLKIYFYTNTELEKLTVYQWLVKEKQNENIRKAFWDFIAIGTLNTNINKASAKIFSDILKQMFFRGNFSATIILPKYGLSQVYCLNSEQFIKEKGGEVVYSELVNEIKIENRKTVEVVTNKRNISNFDFVISALPLYSLLKLTPEKNYFNFPELKYSSILSIHIWLKENNLEKTFYGLIDSSVHWIFNHGTHLTLVISDADELIKKDRDELYSMMTEELKKYFDINEEQISSYKIIKEKRSTFIPSSDVLKKRPSQNTKIDNFILAGDWVDTGLPATIESAVKSGKVAAEIISKLGKI